MKWPEIFNKSVFNEVFLLQKSHGLPFVFFSELQVNYLEERLKKTV